MLAKWCALVVDEMMYRVVSLSPAPPLTDRGCGPAGNQTSDHSQRNQDGGWVFSIFSILFILLFYKLNAPSLAFQLILVPIPEICVLLPRSDWDCGQWG